MGRDDHSGPSESARQTGDPDMEIGPLISHRGRRRTTKVVSEILESDLQSNFRGTKAQVANCALLLIRLRPGIEFLSLSGFVQIFGG